MRTRRLLLSSLLVAAMAVAPCLAAPRTPAKARAPRLDPKVIRYAQSVYYGEPFHMDKSSKAQTVRRLLPEARRFFASKTPDEVYRLLDPYVEELYPGTFPFTSVVWTLAYYTDPNAGSYQRRDRWRAYVGWVPLFYAGLPHPSQPPVTGLLPSPNDEGGTMDRALVRLYRKHNSYEILNAFFGLTIGSNGGTDPYLEAVQYLVLANPTAVLRHAARDEDARRHIVRALTHFEMRQGERHEKVLAAVEKVAAGVDEAAAEAARKVLDLVRKSADART